MTVSYEAQASACLVPAGQILGKKAEESHKKPEAEEAEKRLGSIVRMIQFLPLLGASSWRLCWGQAIPEMTAKQ